MSVGNSGKAGKHPGTVSQFSKPRREASSKLSCHLFEREISDEIALLARIALEVVEHVDDAVRVDRELPPARPKHHARFAKDDFAQLPGSNFRKLTFDERPQRLAQAAGRSVAAAGLDERRKEVDDLDERVAHRARGDASGPARKERDAHVRLVKCRLLEALVVAEHLAMVGDEDDKGVIEPSPSLERVQYPADVIVDEGNLAVVVRPDARDVGE